MDSKRNQVIKSEEEWSLKIQLIRLLSASDEIATLYFIRGIQELLLHTGWNENVWVI